MSYSISVKNPERAALISKLQAELAGVCETQPMHKGDAAAGFDAACSLLAHLPDEKEGQAYNLTINGSIAWRGDNPPAEGDGKLTSIAVSISAHTYQVEVPLAPPAAA